jgi:hypothetical protein
VKAAISITGYCNRTALVLFELFAASQRLRKWARIPVQGVLYSRGLDYRHGSVAGWSKPIALNGAAGLRLSHGRKFRGKSCDCQGVVTVEGRL